MTTRGERAAAFCKLAALYIDDDFEAQCCTQPYADGTYQSQIRFDGLDVKGHARFSRQMYLDKANRIPFEVVQWRESPTRMFRTLRHELHWDAVGQVKLEQHLQADPVHSKLASLIVGAKFPSAWIRAAEAMAAAKRHKPD